MWAFVEFTLLSNLHLAVPVLFDIVFHFIPSVYVSCLSLRYRLVLEIRALID